MASPTLFHHPEFDDEDYGDGEAFATQAGRHIQELQRLSAFQQVTTKVPPAYDGRMAVAVGSRTRMPSTTGWISQS